MFTLDTYPEGVECLYSRQSFSFWGIPMKHLPDPSRVMREDLRAQIAPLDRYGLAGLATAIAVWLRTLAGAVPNAVGADQVRSCLG
jgi:hypothetical protein